MTRGIITALCLGLVAMPWGSAQADDADVPTQAAKESITVTIPVRTIDTPGRSGQSGIVEIRVGDSAPLAVMLDTGSVGLRLWGGRPAAAAVTSKPVESTVDGAQVPGLLGKATMTFGGVSTTMAVPFQLINTDSRYIQQWKSKRVVGILGIGVGSGELTNPLVALPGSLGLRWSVHFARKLSAQGGAMSALVLGADASPDAQMSFPLTYLGLNVNGALLWDDHAAGGCWTIGTMREQCVPTWFDSGFTVMRIKGLQFARLPQTASHRLRSGTPVALAAGNSAFVGHQFTAGSTGSRDLASVLPTRQATINTGNSFYFDYTVSYDVAQGVVSLYAPSRKRS